MTLKEIADLAGVSIMTVSNVINGKHNRVGICSQLKRTQFNEQKLQYHSNHHFC